MLHRDRGDATAAPARLDTRRRVLHVLRAGCRRATVLPGIAPQARAGRGTSTVGRDREPAKPTEHGGPTDASESAGLDQVHRRRADEAGDEQVGRARRRGPAASSTCCSTPLLHHRDPVAHRHRLDLVVGDVDRRDAEVALRAARSRRASAPAAWRRGSTAARPSGTPAAGARSPGPSPPAGAGRRRAAPRLAVEELARARGCAPPRRPAASISALGHLARASGRTPCCRTRSCAGRARSSGTPSRCRGPSAGRR